MLKVSISLDLPCVGFLDLKRDLSFHHLLNAVESYLPIRSSVMRNFNLLVLFAECSTSFIVRQTGDLSTGVSDSLVKTTDTDLGSFDLSMGNAQPPGLIPEVTHPTSHESELALASPISDDSLTSYPTDTDNLASMNPPSYLMAGAADTATFWNTIGQAIAICYSVFAYYAHQIQAFAPSQSSDQRKDRGPSTTYESRWVSELCPVEIYGYHTDPLCDLGFMRVRLIKSLSTFILDGFTDCRAYLSFDLQW